MIELFEPVCAACVPAVPSPTILPLNLNSLAVRFIISPLISVCFPVMLVSFIVLPISFVVGVVLTTSGFAFDKADS